MAERCRLLVLAQGYPCPANPLSGAYHRDQLRLVAEAGIDVTVVVPVPWVPPGIARLSGKWAAYDVLPATQRDGTLSIYRPRYLAMPRENRRGLPDLFQALAVRRLLRRIGYGRPDVLHAFFALPTGAVARALAADWKIPYGVSLLGDDINIYPHHNRRNMRLVSAVLRDADARLANGPSLAATASALASVPVESLSIGVWAARFADLPPKAEARHYLNLPADATIALYVGAHSVNKGMAELGAAMDSLAGRNLVLATVGDGPWRADLAARGNVRTLGMQPAEQVALAMAAADLMVHPSHYEGLPTVLVEAALAGLPIITTDAAGCIDLARDGRAVMVPVGDADALANALAHAIAEPDAMRACERAMAAHVAENYELETNTARLVEHVRRMAARK